MRPRLPALVVVAALVAALTGCGSDDEPGSGASPTETPSPTATTLAADWSAHAPDIDLKGWKLPGDTVQLSPPTVFQGPNFSYALGVVAVTPELPPGFAQQFGLPPKATAAAGHEIVLAQFVERPPGIRPLVDTPGSPASFEVLGGPKVDPEIFGRNYPRGVLAFSVPTGGHPVLKVTDEGRVQSLDLRTGKRGSDAVPGFHPLRYADHSFPSPGRTGWVYLRMSGPGAASIPSGRRLAATWLDDLEVVLSPWAPGGGWAPPGKAWLLVEPTVLSGQVDTVKPEVSFELAPASFQVTGSDGKTYPLRGEPVSSTPLAPSPILTAQVPASLTSVTVRFAPKGAGTSKQGKVRLSPYRGGPQSAKLKL